MLSVGEVDSIKIDVWSDVCIREVTNKQDLDLINEIAHEWEAVALEKMRYFGKSQELNKVYIARDARQVCQDIRYHMDDYTPELIKNGVKAVYAAYDNQEKIQGVAFVILETIKPSILHLLSVNPERTKSLNSETTILGIGTKLVKEVCNKILQDNRMKELGVCPLPSSIPFYQKLGFEFSFENKNLMRLKV